MLLCTLAGQVRWVSFLTERIGGKMLKLVFCMIVGATLVASGGPISSASFGQCPAVGANTLGCELLITVSAVNGAGAATAFSVATASPDQGPYDGVEDTLIGIVNSAATTLNSIQLSGFVGGDGIFDFDGDGACATIGCVGGDVTGYGGPGVTFSGIGGTLNSSGTVNFTGGVPNGASRWFSLEGPVTASVLNPAPEPGSIVLFGP